MSRDPARIIGIVLSSVLASLMAAAWWGLIPGALASGALTIVSILSPIIGAEISRRFVTPVARPTLPEGTVVKVVTPGDEPNRLEKL